LKLKGNNPISNAVNTAPNFSSANDNSNNYNYSASMRGYGNNHNSNYNNNIIDQTNPLVNNTNEFLSSFNPKNYMNNPNLAANGIKNPSPIKVFSNYYLNNSDPNNIDHGYSRKKNFLMKDFYAKDKPDRDEFIK